jgi:hypothetical protein
MDFLGKNVAANIKTKKEIKTNGQHSVDTEYNLTDGEEGRTHNMNLTFSAIKYYCSYLRRHKAAH